MRRHLLTTVLLLPLASWAQQTPVPAQPATPSAPAVAQPDTAKQLEQQYCSMTRKEFPSCGLKGDEHKHAQKKYEEGLKLAASEKLEQSLARLTEATDLSPRDIDYVTAREMVSQKLVYKVLERANRATMENRPVEAMGAFRQALAIDPHNEYAQQQLKASLPAVPRQGPIREETLASNLELQPRAGTASLHFRGYTRELLTQLATTYGLTAVVEDGVLNRNLKVNLDEADWPQALAIVTRMTHTMAVPLSPRQVLFVDNTGENRNQLEPMAVRTYYVGGLSTQQEMNDLIGAMRTLFDLKFILPNQASQTITVRAPVSTLDALSSFMQDLDQSRAQVMLNIRVFQVSRTFVRKFGADLPTSFTAFNLVSEARKLLGNQSLSEILSELQSGTLSSSSATAALALMAQGSSQSSLLLSPFMTFGGGLTMTGIAFSGSSLNLAESKSELKNLQEVSLRASQGNPASLKIGQRYPIITTTYSSAITSSLLSRYLGTSSSSTSGNPYPSFQFEDIGLTIKATPHLQRSGNVVLSFEMQLRTLGASNSIGIPIINNREYSGDISCERGESIVIAGYLSDSDVRSLSGFPLLSSLTGNALGTRSRQKDNDELLVVITPQVLTSNPPQTSPIIPLPSTK